MRKTPTLVTVFALAALAAGAAAVFAGPMHRFGPRERLGHRGDFLAVALDLSDEQRAAIGELREEFHASTLVPFLTEKRQLRESIREELESAAPDALRLGELLLEERDLEARMRDAQEAHHQQVETLLTDEQRTRLEELKSLRGERRGRHLGRPGGLDEPGGFGERGPRRHFGPFGPPSEQP